MLDYILVIFEGVTKEQTKRIASLFQDSTETKQTNK